MADPSPLPQSTVSSSSWTAFLKSIASFNGDLSSLTAPPFILSGQSLTEYSAYWCEHPSLFCAPAKEPDPEKRALLVLKWFLSTLKQQYASRSEKYGNEKKPLNPFLGELFLGKWEDPENGVTELISEQVSHHPPATAYSITNFKTGVHLEGYNAQKASFSRTINIKQIGHAVMTIPVAGSPDPETWVFTLPSLHCEGLILGSPFMELDGRSFMASSSGYMAKIDFSGKGWLSGKKNSFTAGLYSIDNGTDALYSVAGQWTKGFDIFKGASKKDLVGKWDAASPEAVTSKLSVVPIEQQHPLESRRAWQKVAEAILAGDMDTVGREKGKIETAQRQMRAKEEAEGRTWERRYFSDARDPEARAGTISEDRKVVELLGVAGLTKDGDADKTGGLWRFSEAKAEKARAASALTAEEAKAVALELLGQTNP